MKRVCLFFVLLILFCAGNDHAYLRGTVTHILSDRAENPQRLVKVRLDKPREFVLIDMPEVELKPGDNILLNKIIEDTNNYGIDSSFEEQFEFMDFARDRSIFLLLIIWLPALLLLNKKTWLLVAAILLNLGLLLFILPLALPEQLFLFILFFYALNFLLAYFLLPKTLPAILAALAGSGASGLVYMLLIQNFHITPLQYPSLGAGHFNFPAYTDVCILIIMSFYLCIFSTSFLVSFRRKFYNNIRLFFLQNFLLFLFLAAGLLLPCLLYFRLNNLDPIYLFNYPPFIYPLLKLLLCLLAVQLSGSAYFIYFYLKNRPAVDQPGETQNAPKAVSLQKVLEQHQRKPSKKNRRR